MLSCQLREAKPDASASKHMAACQMFIIHSVKLVWPLRAVSCGIQQIFGGFCERSGWPSLGAEPMAACQQSLPKLHWPRSTKDGHLQDSHELHDTTHLLPPT